MPTKGPSLDESGQEQSGESLQAPGNSAKEAPASKKSSVARLAKLVGTTAAITVLATPGCNLFDDETSPNTDPAPDKTAPSGDKFMANANYCRSGNEVDNPELNLKARPSGATRLVRFTDNDGTPRFYHVCTNGSRGKFVPKGKTECTNDNGDMDCAVTLPGPNGQEYLYTVEDTSTISDEAVLKLLGHRTVAEINRVYGELHFVGPNGVAPIPGHLQVALGLWKKDGVPEEKPVVVKPTPRPARTVVQRRRPSNIDRKQDKKIAALEDRANKNDRTNENQNAILARHGSDIERIGLYSYENRRAIDLINKSLETKGTGDGHDYNSYADQVSGRQ